MDKKQLNYYYNMVQETILKYQHPATGLIANSYNSSDCWVRDNTYALLAIWGLSLAYKKLPDVDEDRFRGAQLEKNVVKSMRGLLRCFMKQSHKVERFKATQNPLDSLHAKYNSATCRACVGDGEWGHLQIDATSLFLLTLGQMTSSGLRIIWTYEEVAMVQNLVFYIEMAYRVPDYGTWERGDKTNHGLPELNTSSVGMAKAALEAMSELDLFGEGDPFSMVHVLPDETQQCQAVLQTMLPRESLSKETDSALLPIIGYPAFSVDDENLIALTWNTIRQNLEGSYGFKRFLRDGYRTVNEDPNRLHYESFELKRFENLECEWPMLIGFVVLSAFFRDNQELASHYMSKLQKNLIPRNRNFMCVAESFTLPHSNVEKEKQSPGSQTRIVVGKLPYLWGQSLFVLCKLIDENFLLPGELDPLGRRMVTEPKPDLVVQVVVIAEDVHIQERLANYNFHVQTFEEIRNDAGVRVFPAKVLGYFYKQLGVCKSLGLSGRLNREVGILATSKLYTIGKHTLAFTPQSSDRRQFYVACDVDLLLNMIMTELAYLRHSWNHLGRPLVLFPVQEHLISDMNSFYLSADVQFAIDYFKTDVAFLRKSWNSSGRPTLVLPIYERELLRDTQTLQPALVSTIKKLQSGYINGTRVELGHMSEFMSTSCVAKLDFIQSDDDVLTKARVHTSHGSHHRLACSAGSRSPALSGPSLRRMSTVLANSLNMELQSQTEGDSREKLPSLTETINEFYGVSLSHTPMSSPPPFEDSRFSAFDDELMDVHREDVSDIQLIGPKNSKLTSLEGESTTHHLRSPGDLNLGNLCDSDVPLTNDLSMARRYRSGVLDQSTDFANSSPEDLVDRLSESANLYHQAEIIFHLATVKGIDWDTHMGGSPCTVRDLLKEVYERAGQSKIWWLVRHAAGVLKKRVEHIAKAITDLLVRQKQVTIGLPPEPREKVITSPMSPDKLAELIMQACESDLTMAMLTQEILVYLAMFARTEPTLLLQMNRIRVGLIIQVMASEIARTLMCSAEAASSHLISLSPFETKTLLHHILNGKEFQIEMSTDSMGVEHYQITSDVDRAKMGTAEIDDDSGMSNRAGQWLRRRKIDGALNRVPPGFYPRLYKLLMRCKTLCIQNMCLDVSLTYEMTSGETKFALAVERIMNNIPTPEYRQLLVEALVMLGMLNEIDKKGNIDLGGKTIAVDYLVHEAHDLFLKDQAEHGGDATTCCVSKRRKSSGEGIQPTDYEWAPGGMLTCRKVHGICVHFYDTAPSGRYGTITYLVRALSKVIEIPTNEEGNIPSECLQQ